MFKILIMPSCPFLKVVKNSLNYKGLTCSMALLPIMLNDVILQIPNADLLASGRNKREGACSEV